MSACVFKGNSQYLRKTQQRLPAAADLQEVGRLFFPDLLRSDF